MCNTPDSAHIPFDFFCFSAVHEISGSRASEDLRIRAPPETLCCATDLLFGSRHLSDTGGMQFNGMSWHARLGLSRLAAAALTFANAARVAAGAAAGQLHANDEHVLRAPHLRHGERLLADDSYTSSNSTAEASGDSDEDPHMSKIVAGIIGISACFFALAFVAVVLTIKDRFGLNCCDGHEGHGHHGSDAHDPTSQARLRMKKERLRAQAGEPSKPAEGKKRTRVSLQLNVGQTAPRSAPAQRASSSPAVPVEYQGAEEAPTGVDGADASGDWMALEDAEGNTYYYNSRTGVTQWEVPEELAIQMTAL